MKYRFIAVILASALLTAGILGGCGSKETSSETASAAESQESTVEEDSSAPEETEASSDETEFSEAEADSSESEAETEEYPTMTPTEDNVFDPGFEPQTIMDESFDPTVVEDPDIPESPDGEGTVSFAGEKVSVSADAVAAEIGSDCTVKDPSGAALCSVKIDSMEVSDIRSDFEEDAANVILVRYTVSGVESSDPVYVGPSSFRLIDESSTACRSYELDPEAEPQSQIAPLGKGESGSFCIAFALDKKPSELTLVYGDPESTGSGQYTLAASQDLLAALS